MAEALGFWAATPFWFRLIVCYVALSLMLGAYKNKRDLGSSVAGAIGGVVVDTVWGAVSFTISLFLKKV